MSASDEGIEWIKDLSDEGRMCSLICMIVMRNRIRVQNRNRNTGTCREDFLVQPK